MRMRVCESYECMRESVDACECVNLDAIEYEEKVR